MAGTSPSRPAVSSLLHFWSSAGGRATRGILPSVGGISVLLAFQAGLAVVSPLMLQRIIDAAGPGASVTVVIIPGLLAAAAALANAVVDFAAQRMTVVTGQRFQERLRVLMLDKLTRLPTSDVAAAPNGDALSRITNDTAQAQSFVSSMLPQLAGLVTRLGVLLGVMWSRSYTITLTVVVLALVLMVPTEKVSRMLSAATDHMLEAMSAFSNTVADRMGVSGHLFARTAASIRGDHRRAEQTAAGVRTSYARMITIDSLFSTALDLIGTVGTVMVLVIGGRSVIRGEMTAGELAALAVLVPQLYAPLQGSSGIRTGLATSWAALSRVNEFLEADEHWYEPANVGTAITPRGSETLAVREVDYSVPTDTGSTVLLDAVDLTARPGEIVAVVGPSGSGKTTLLTLIAGANRPTHGSISVGGYSPTETGTEAWNGMVQLCPQEPFFRSGTLLENFRAVRPDISEERVRQLCARVGLDLDRLGDRSGMDTMLGEHGMRISGGERARLASARMLALDPYVLLFDEPTAALDDEAADRFIATLLDLRRDHCIVVTTHDARLAPVTDRRYRMDAGRLTPMTTATAGVVGAGVPS